MAVVTFVLVTTSVSDGAGGWVEGPVASIPTGYRTALKRRLTDYWRDVSGGRVDVAWADDIWLELPQTLAEWQQLDDAAKVNHARAQGRVPPGTHVILIANDASEGSASNPPGSSPYVHSTWLSPAMVAHEMGHFFEWAGSRRGGHADVARTFFRDEYGDPTCVMGGEGNKLSFRDPAVPALTGRPGSNRSGPLMNPALVDQCGWLDPGSPLVTSLDATTLGSVTLQPWTGAPAEGAVGGAPRLAIIDGVGPEARRLYVCVRAPSGWDRAFTPAWLVAPWGAPTPVRWVCAYLETAAEDSLLLANRLAVETGSIPLGLVPIRIRVGRVTPEGVDLEFFREPWRGSAPIEGVECAPHAQVAVAAWGRTADIYVIDREGAVRYNHFNGDGWEHKPWPWLEGVTCDPLGGIAAVARVEGLVDVFVVDTDGAVQRLQRHHRTWSGWRRVEGGGLGRLSSLAASRLDGRTIMLCGVRPSDGLVSRTEIDEDGVAATWRTAPAERMHRVAATPAEDLGGRIYATSVHNRDRTIWDTPDITARDPGRWDVVGTLLFEAARPISASRMVGGSDVVVAGTAPVTVLFHDGTGWVPETLPDLDREADGGLACFTMEPDEFHLAFIDRAGVVQVGGFSRRQDFRPAVNQYEAETTVAFQVGTGHFIQAKEGGGAGMGADSGNLGPWEKFQLLECETYVINAGATRRVVVFKTHDGHYVGAVGGGGSHLIATATQVGPWERFYLHDLGYSRVTVGCIDEVNFWTAPGGGGGPMGADKSEAKEWETFTMVPVQP